MTTDLAPYRSARPVGRDGFAKLLLAEFSKFRTVRAWMIALGATAIVLVLLSYLSALVSQAPPAHWPGRLCPDAVQLHA